MDLDDARRMLADLGVPDLDAHLRQGWQSIETGRIWAWEQDQVKTPPARREYPDEDGLARALVIGRLQYQGLPVPDDPLPPRAWTVERHLTAGAAVGRTVDLATGTQTDLRADNDMFALGRITGPRPRVRIPWRRAELPQAVRHSAVNGPWVGITPVADDTGTARYLIVQREDSRHPAEGIRLELWG